MSDTTLILKSAHFAAMKHSRQRRKDVEASPYINHPLTLARVLAEEGGIKDVPTLCAALRCCTTRSRTPRPPSTS